MEIIDNVCIKGTATRNSFTINLLKENSFWKGEKYYISFSYDKTEHKATTWDEWLIIKINAELINRFLDRGGLSQAELNYFQSEDFIKISKCLVGIIPNDFILHDFRYESITFYYNDTHTFLKDNLRYKGDSAYIHKEYIYIQARESGSGKRVSHEFKSHRFKESLSLFWGLNLWLHFNTNSLELSFNPWLGHANSFSDTIFTNFGMREVKGCGYEEVLKNKRLLK